MASSSIGSAVAAFKYGAGRISALASAPASSPAALAAGLAGIGDNLELAGLNESGDGRVFGRPCADLAFFARAQEKPLPARKRNVQWFLRRVLDRRQNRVSPLKCIHPQLDRGARIVATGHLDRGCFRWGRCLRRLGPSGAAKVREREVGFFFSKDVGIDSKRHFGVPVAEL